jgi:L-alanine-DL-glutamate epimerase-like enolase superfamily enzyme
MNESIAIEVFDKHGHLRGADTFTEDEMAQMDETRRDLFYKLRSAVRTTEAAKSALDAAIADLAGKVRRYQALRAAQFKPLSIAQRERIFRAELEAARAS